MTFVQALEASLESGAMAALETYLSGGNKDAIEAAGRAAVVSNTVNTIVSSVATTTT
jgi:hypothetical protein